MYIHDHRCCSVNSSELQVATQTETFNPAQSIVPVVIQGVAIPAQVELCKRSHVRLVTNNNSSNKAESQKKQNIKNNQKIDGDANGII